MKLRYQIQENLPIIVMIVGSLLYNCSNPQQTKQIEIARFENEILTLDQINIPTNLNSSDSIEYITQKTEEWLKRQSLAKKAMENVDDKDKTIEKQVNEYRTTLYIHEYKQRLTEQKVDTTVTQAQIEEYYTKYGDEYSLTYPLVKAWVVIVPISMPKQTELLKLLRSDDESTKGDLKEMCFQTARYYNFDNNWRPMHTLLNEANITIQQINSDNIWKGKIVSLRQEEVDLHVKIIDYLKIGEKPPLASVTKQIKEIIIQKRKDVFFSRLENDLLQSIKNQSKIKI